MKQLLRKLITAAPLLGLCSGTLAVPIEETWKESGDAGHLVGTAQDTLGTTELSKITGRLHGANNVDMFRIFVPDLSAFEAWTVGETAKRVGNGKANRIYDPMLYLFDAAGNAVAANDDAGTLANILDDDDRNKLAPDLFEIGSNVIETEYSSQSWIDLDTGLAASGWYLLAITRFERFPKDAGNKGLFYKPNQNKFFPGLMDGIIKDNAEELAKWGGQGMTRDINGNFIDWGRKGRYTIRLEGAEFAGEPLTDVLSDATVSTPDGGYLLACGLIGLVLRRNRGSL